MELAAFERLGRQAVEQASPAETVWVSGASMAHAWRAQQLEALLPVSAGLPTAEECTSSPGPLVEEWLATLSGATAPDWYRTLEAAYRRRLLHADLAAEPATARVLARVLADLAISTFPGGGGTGHT